MERVDATLEKLVLQAVEREGFELVDMEYKQGAVATLNVYIYHPDGVSLDDCSFIARRLSELLDAEDIIEGHYNLVVSSPGLDRPLRSIRDFKRRIGEMVSIKRTDGSQIKGRLIGVSEAGVELTDGDEHFLLPIDSIERGKVLIEFR